MKRNIALLRYNPDLENVAVYRMIEVSCLHFLNRLSGIAQFGFLLKTISYGYIMQLFYGAKRSITHSLLWKVY